VDAHGGARIYAPAEEDVIFYWKSFLAGVITGLLILWAVSVYAEPDTREWRVVPRTERVWVLEQPVTPTTPVELDVLAFVELNSCLNLMEWVMRAMDPYLPYVENGKVLDPVELSAVIHELYDAGMLWNAVKRKCWKNP
jgi:hypothetical protein